jgi:hypothetical protein
MGFLEKMRIIHKLSKINRKKLKNTILHFKYYYYLLVKEPQNHLKVHIMRYVYSNYCVFDFQQYSDYYLNLCIFDH